MKQKSVIVAVMLLGLVYGGAAYLSGTALIYPKLFAANVWTGTNRFTKAVTASAGVVGTVTGNITGNLTGNVTGNVAGATGAFTASTTIGSGTPLLAVNSGTATWDPASLADGESANVGSITCTCAVGDPMFAGLTTITTAGWQISATCTATNTAAVTITNRTGGPVDLASGTVRVARLKF